MADFGNATALGTQRMNPSSMVPGAMGGNAPQGGFSTQARSNQMAALARQLGQGAPKGQPPAAPRLQMPPAPSGQYLPASPQQAAPSAAPAKVSSGKKSMKPEDFDLLADVFSTISKNMTK